MPQPFCFHSWLRRRRRFSSRPARPLSRNQPTLEVLEDRLAPSIGITIPLGDGSAPAALTPPVAFSTLSSTPGIQMTVVSQGDSSGLPPDSLVVYIDPVDFDLRSPTGQRLEALIDQNAASNPFYKTDGVNGLLTVPAALAGRYQLQLAGTGTEPFRFSVSYVSSQGQATSYLFQGYLQGLSPLFVLDFGEAADTRIASSSPDSSLPNSSGLAARIEDHTAAAPPASYPASSPQAGGTNTITAAAAATFSSLLLALHTIQPALPALGISPSPHLELSATTGALEVATGLGAAAGGGASSASDFDLGASGRMPHARLLEAATFPVQNLGPETRLAGEPRALPDETAILREAAPELDQVAFAAAPVKPAELFAAPPVPGAAEESEEGAVSETVEAPTPIPEPFLTRARAVAILLATALAGGLQHTLVDRGARIGPTIPGRKPRESSAS